MENVFREFEGRLPRLQMLYVGHLVLRSAHRHLAKHPEQSIESYVDAELRAALTRELQSPTSESCLAGGSYQVNS